MDKAGQPKEHDGHRSLLTKIKSIEYKINNGIRLNDYDTEEIMEIFIEVKNILSRQ